MVKDKTLYDVKIINAKALAVNLKVPNTKQFIDRFHIKSVKFNDSESIELGEEIPVMFKTKTGQYNTYYNTNYIYKEDKDKIQINEFEDTISTTYVLPLIGIQKKNLLIDLNFINCYIGHCNHEHELGKYIYLMYRYTPTEYYSEFSKILQRQENFTYYFKDIDQRFDCFIFKTKKIFIEDVNIILKGQYSSISNKAKKTILNFHNQNNPNAPIYQILFKGYLRKNELEESLGCTLPEDIDYEDKPNINNEIWNYSKAK